MICTVLVPRHNELTRTEDATQYLRTEVMAEHEINKFSSKFSHDSQTRRIRRFNITKHSHFSHFKHCEPSDIINTRFWLRFYTASRILPRSQDHRLPQQPMRHRQVRFIFFCHVDKQGKCFAYFTTSWVARVNISWVDTEK